MEYGPVTLPQEARQLAGMLPSCPGCGAHNSSGDDPDLAVIRRTPRAEPTADAFPYTCGVCWTLFAGSDDEWRRMRPHREARAEKAAKRAARGLDDEARTVAASLHERAARLARPRTPAA